MRITRIQAARNRIPGKNDKELDFLIWEVTAYPFVRSYKWLRQLVCYIIWSKEGIGSCYCCGRPYLSDSGKVEKYKLCGYCTKEDLGA